MLATHTPFVGSRLKVDVVDPNPELLDQAESFRPGRPPG